MASCNWRNIKWNSKGGIKDLYSLYAYTNNYILKTIFGGGGGALPPKTKEWPWHYARCAIRKVQEDRNVEP